MCVFCQVGPIRITVDVFCEEMARHVFCQVCSIRIIVGVFYEDMARPGMPHKRLNLRALFQ